MKRCLHSALAGVLALVFGYLLYKCSTHLAAMRIYHVEECRNVWLAHTLSTGGADGYSFWVDLLLVPLIWLSRGATQTIDLLVSARMLALMLFWINLLLLALATGERLLSRRGMIALFGACTLAPFWDFGIEFRSENLLLTGLLMTWCCVRFGRDEKSSYLLAGAMSVAMQFMSSRAWIFVVPLAVALFLFPRSRESSRVRLFAAWFGGVVGMFLLIYVSYRATGIWDAFVAGLPLMWSPTVEEADAGRWMILGRLLWQTPLLLALLFPGFIAVIRACYHREKPLAVWESSLPEATFFILTLLFLLLSASPQPNDLLAVVAFGYLLAYRYAVVIIEDAWASHLVRPLVITVILFVHLVPFYAATRRHLAWPNYRQEAVIRFAEQFTAPDTDRVYDGNGILPTRKGVRSQWFIEGLNVRNAKAPETLDGLPAAVVIQSHRTLRLPSAESDFIGRHYVPLGDDFLVLGANLPRGGGEFKVIHPGRYRVSAHKQSNLLGTYPEGLVELMKASATREVEIPFIGTLDGVAVSNRPVDLSVGIHRVQSEIDDEISVVWVGPNLEKPPQVGRGDRRWLFVDVY